MKPLFFKLIQQPWVILTSWFIFVMFSVIVLPAVSFQASVEGIRESIDTNFTFDPSLIYQIVANYGENGRQYYIWQRWTFDLVWPVVYAAPLFFTLHRFSNLLKWQKIAFIIYFPLFAMGFDYLENITFTILVSQYPSVYVFLPYIGVFFSFFKWIFLALAFLMTLLSTTIVLWRYLEALATQKSH